MLKLLEYFKRVYRQRERGRGGAGLSTGFTNIFNFRGRDNPVKTG
jgi:hypothetical protein